MKSVYSAVRTGSLNEAVRACATYSINLMVFITEMKSVYSAVRTGALSKAVCASSLKGQYGVSVIVVHEYEFLFPSTSKHRRKLNGVNMDFLFHTS
jgi:hypothetical protein